jgi:uncharacterized protein (DUF1697 family)
MPTRSTTRYVALLRAINVGGHVVKMDVLRKHFTKMGFGNVETFIASGNVLFDAAEPVAEIEQRIAFELERALGYPVGTFVRTPDELAAVVRHEAFPVEVIDPSKHALYIGFLGSRPSAERVRQVVALRTPVDELHIHKRELYWGCRVTYSQTQVKGPALARALGTEMTVRNITTVRRLAQRLSSVL